MYLRPLQSYLPPRSANLPTNSVCDLVAAVNHDAYYSYAHLFDWQRDVTSRIDRHCRTQNGSSPKLLGESPSCLGPLKCPLKCAESVDLPMDPFPFDRSTIGSLEWSLGRHKIYIIFIKIYLMTLSSGHADVPICLPDDQTGRQIGSQQSTIEKRGSMASIVS